MNYVGIDLGTTNSAICSYDGEHVTLYKSPEQLDVTPSAIHIDRRGNRLVGMRAYNAAAQNPGNAATGFKRLIGTNTSIRLSSIDLTLTPEECSSEILRVLFGYLPETFREAENTGTVVTVPAAFNQMQRDATMSAATAAGIGRVALMQEPVAAVMSVLRSRPSDGIFIVYDLGGGTLDVAIAQSVNGRVTLMGHGGIEMCGGRDFDRALFKNVVQPWLFDNFDLPHDFESHPSFRSLFHFALWAIERAKIELSRSPEAVISLSEAELRLRDVNGADIYLDVPLSRTIFDRLIADQVADSVQSAEETLREAGLKAQDVERVVFVGGPTQYKPLREKVASALGVAASTDVNPMTAVAEGAALFAESVDWSSRSRPRKPNSASLASAPDLGLTLNYTARTCDGKARLVAKAMNVALGTEIQVDSMDTGWSSGRRALVDGAGLEVPLAKPGPNAFKVFVFDSLGRPVQLPDSRILIERTTALVDAIPSSHSIAIEVQDGVGRGTRPDFLIRKGDPLPQKGQRRYKAVESLRAGGPGGINFRIFEGEIEDNIAENRFVGIFSIKGSDLEHGVVPAGADLNVDYEFLDSGQIQIEVTVPSVAASFKNHQTFYSRREAGQDYAHAAQLLQQQTEQVAERLDEIAERVEDPRIEQARAKLQRAQISPAEVNSPEPVKNGLEQVQDARRLIAQTRAAHRSTIRQMDLDAAKDFFNETVRRFAKSSEAAAFDSLVVTAQRAIDQSGPGFESHLSELRSSYMRILWRQEWFVIDRFKYLAEHDYFFPDVTRHRDLVTQGSAALENSDIESLRAVVGEMYEARWAVTTDDDLATVANIMKG